MLPVAGYITASIVSYIRAKADALGFDAHTGIVERAERFLLLGIGLLFYRNLLIPILALIVVLNVITAAQRFIKVWGQATRQTPALSDRRRRRPRSADRTVAQRWQSRSASRGRQGGSRRPPT
jgi:CDP-diacylglycerol--glycerol-3-phosphate 3-phosphatidyltransferase